tara:strand:- start:105 stop:347 length:243 start_codon:yes stop_codon:yes gene_type:complete
MYVINPISKLLKRKLFKRTKLIKKSIISKDLFLRKIEIVVKNKDATTKISKLINAEIQIIDKNNILNPCLGTIAFLIYPK